MVFRFRTIVLRSLDREVNFSNLNFKVWKSSGLFLPSTLSCGFWKPHDCVRIFQHLSKSSALSLGHKKNWKWKTTTARNSDSGKKKQETLTVVKKTARNFETGEKKRKKPWQWEKKTARNFDSGKTTRNFDHSQKKTQESFKGIESRKIIQW